MKPNDKIPSWPLRFLRLYCPEHLYEEIEGDLLQRFEKDVQKYGNATAQRRLAWNALRFFRPGIIIRNRISVDVNTNSMMQSYLKTTLRHVARSKINFAFKLGGLSLALFSFLVIALYISYQMSFDTYHDGYERIYRVNSERLEGGKQVKYGIVPSAMGEMLKNDFPEVEAATRINIGNGDYLRYKDKVVFVGAFPADSSLFDVLTFKFISGDRSALDKPNSIVLTKSTAKKVFGNEDPLHKIVNYTRDKIAFEVTGIIEDMPSNSHFGLDGFVPYAGPKDLTIGDIQSPVSFVDKACILFVKLRSQSNASAFVEKIETLLDKHIGRSERLESGFHIFLQPITSIYLDESLAYDFSRKGSAMYLYIFSLLGFFLLIVASINYINLSIADFGSRSREIGVRKIMGARRYQIVGQIMAESVMYCFISLGIGVLLLYIAFPEIAGAIDRNLRFDMILQKPFVIMALATAVLLVILTSAYPALKFSTSNTAGDLKNTHSTGYNSIFNKSLLFAQFIISIISMVATLTVARQIDFIRSKDIGVDREGLAVLMMPDYVDPHQYKGFQAAVGALPGVTHVSNSSFRVGGAYWKSRYMVDVEGEEKMFELYEVFSDDQLFSTLGIKLLEGRTFRSDLPGDSTTAFVVNETAVRELGLKNPVGTRISLVLDPEETGTWKGTIVGVVADVNISPLREAIKPLVMRLPWQNTGAELFMYVKMNGDVSATMKAVEETFHKMVPGFPSPDFELVDDFLAARYRTENQAFASLQFGSVLIIFLSSIGIFSMSIFVSLRRTKEFGIRKVLGASLVQIATLHTGYFLRVVLLANAVAVPVAYFLMKEWLDSFAYRTELSMPLFLIVTSLSLAIVVASASYSAWKSGTINPVDAIKMQN